MNAWYTTLDVGRSLTGSSVAEVLSAVASGSQASCCRVYGIEGGGKASFFLHEAELDFRVLAIDELISACSSMDQFDWGDFFLGPPLPETFGFPRNKYCEALGSSLVLMRCIDSSYVDLCGTNRQVGKALSRKFPDAEFGSDHIQGLIFPR